MMKNKLKTVFRKFSPIVPIATLIGMGAVAATVNLNFTPRPASEQVQGYYIQWTSNFVSGNPTNWGSWIPTGLGTNIDLELNPGQYAFRGMASNSWGMGPFGPVVQLPPIPGAISVRVSVTFQAVP